MSDNKIQKIKEMAKQGKGLNDSATQYLLWYLESVEQELYHRKAISSDTKPQQRYILENFPNWIGSKRDEANRGAISRDEYAKWFETALKNKDPITHNGKKP